MGQGGGLYIAFNSLASAPPRWSCRTGTAAPGSSSPTPARCAAASTPLHLPQDAIAAIDSRTGALAVQATLWHTQECAYPLQAPRSWSPSPFSSTRHIHGDSLVLHDVAARHAPAPTGMYGTVQ